MTTTYIIAQIFGLFGMTSSMISFQFKKNSSYFLCMALSGLLFSINFFMIGAVTGCLLNVINILRGYFLIKKFKKWYFLMLIQLMFISATIFSLSVYGDGSTKQFVLSILILVAQIVSTFSMWTDNGKTIRIFQLFVVSPMWLTYDFINFTLGGVLCEIFCITSVIISFVRFGINGFEKN